MAEERRRRLVEVLVEEAERSTEELNGFEDWAVASQGGGAERQRVSAAELLATARRALGSRGLDCELEPNASETGASEDDDPVLDLLLEPLGEAFAGLGGALRRDLAVGRCRLGLRLDPPHLLLDLSWPPSPEDRDRLHAWHGQALESGDGPPGTGLRPVARRHGGEAWFNLGRSGENAHVRLLLPLEGAAEAD
jgi:hypothetical protein